MPTPAPLHRQGLLRPVLAGMALLALAGCGLDTGFEYPLYPIEHHVVILENDDGELVIHREDDKSLLRGQYLVFTNKTAQVVRLSFRDAERLCGVAEAALPAESTVRFQIIGAPRDKEIFFFGFTGKQQSIDGPPNLIVCPPDNPDCH